MSENSTSIDDVFPILEIKDDLMLSCDGTITFGVELNLPQIFSLNSIGFQSIYFEFVRLFQRLPIDCVVHQQNIFTQKTYAPDMSFKDPLLNWNNKALKGRSLMNHKSLLFISISDKSLKRLSFHQSPVFKILNFFNSPYETMDSTIESMKDLRNVF